MEMRYLLAHQFITPGLNHWRKSGIRFAYNLKGEADPQVVYIDPETKLVHPVSDAHSHPVLQDYSLTDENLGNFASEEVIGKEQSNWLVKTQLPASNQNPVTNQSGAYIAPLHTALFSAYLNLPKFFDPVSDEFNLEWYTQAVRLTTIALDISILFAGYPQERMATSTINLRTLSVTNTGITEVISNPDLQIDTNSKLEFITEVQATATLEALATSAELAKVLDYQAMSATGLAQLDLDRLGRTAKISNQAANENISLIKQYGLHNWQLTNLHQDPEVNSLLGTQAIQLNFANEQTAFPYLLNSLTGGIDTNLYQNAQLTDAEARKLQRPVKAVLSQEPQLSDRANDRQDLDEDTSTEPEVVTQELTTKNLPKDPIRKEQTEPFVPSQADTSQPATHNSQLKNPLNSLSHKFVLSETLIGYLTLIFDETGIAIEIVIHPFNASLEHRFIYDLSSKFINLLLKQGPPSPDWETELSELVPSENLEQVITLIRYTTKWIEDIIRP